jgi:hypothetical protein
MQMSVTIYGRRWGIIRQMVTYQVKEREVQEDKLGPEVTEHTNNTYLHPCLRRQNQHYGRKTN